jgi:hypothetical protein
MNASPRHLIVVAAVLAALSVPDAARAQQPTPAFKYADGSPLPVTPWGDPDLQGMWPIMHLFATPLQRNPQYGDRQLLTDEEWKRAQATLDRREQAYQDEQKAGKLNMGHWAESTTRTPASRLTSLISYPTNGQMPALTEKGKALVPWFKSDDTRTVFDWVDDFDAWDRCITRGLPSTMLPYNYDNGVQILQAPGYVVIRNEVVHEARVIPLDSRPALNSAITQWMGEGRGHWEGSTLVVETRNFNGRVHMLITGVPGKPRGDWPSSPSMKVTERFTPVNAKQIDYQMTVEDPDVLTDKLVISYPMINDPDYTFYEYACHEGNSAIRNFIQASHFERGLNPDGTPKQQ